MADLELLAVSAAETLHDISKQALQLGTALQNVAPASGSPTNSIQYLLKMADVLNAKADECMKLGPAHSQPNN